MFLRSHRAIYIFLWVIASLRWLTSVSCASCHTDCRYALVQKICRPFQSQNWAHNSQKGAPLAALFCTADLGWLNIGQLQKGDKRPLRHHFEPVLRTRIRRIHMFWASWIRIPLSSSKTSKKTLILRFFLTFFDFLFLKNDVNVPSKSNNILKINNENSTIQAWICTKMSCRNTALNYQGTSRKQLSIHRC